MTTSGQPSPAEIMIVRKELETKSRIAMAKAAFHKKKTLFASKLDLNLRKKMT
jgi:hypothetical protein